MLSSVTFPFLNQSRGESQDRAKAPEGGKPMLKAVVHINFTDGERQKHGLKNVANILKEE